MRARVRQVFSDGTAADPKARSQDNEMPANREEPTRGLEPRTPSLRVIREWPENLTVTQVARRLPPSWAYSGPTERGQTEVSTWTCNRLQLSALSGPGLLP